MAMMMPLAAMAYYETVDGIRWTYNVRSGEARVESISLVSPLPPSETMDVMIPATLGIYPVTSIGMNVFRYKNWIGSVTIPSSVETIDSGALRGCSGLVSIDVEWDNPVYSSVDGILYNCELTELIQCPGGKSGVVTIPGSVKEILDYAFYNCSGLTSVIIPSDVVKIGRMAFQGCRGLTAVTFPACVARLGDVFPSAYATISEVTICEGVTEIGRYSFQGFRGLITVTIPPSVTNIGDWAFNLNSEVADFRTAA